MKLKKSNKILIALILLGLVIAPTVVIADSGLDSNYTESQSLAGGIFNALLSLGEFITVQPGSEDYSTAHALITIICIITFFIVTAVHIFKLRSKKQNAIEILTRLGISINATIIFSLLCFLTELQLILYIFILAIYIILLVIIVKSILKKRLKKDLIRVKELDKKFDEEEVNREAFNIYNQVQLAWSNFELDKVKELISEKMYNDYIEKMEELKTKNQKNIMDEIEYESNKIVGIDIEDNIETIVCEMDVKCYDYIIDEKENIIKGKKDKKYNYKYKLVLNRNIKTNKYILTEKKILKIKLEGKTKKAKK